MKLHPGRSIKTNLANVVKAQLKLAAKIDGLNDQAKDLLELRTRLEQLLPEAERPVAYIHSAPAFASPNLQPEHYEQPQVELGTVDKLITEQDIRDAVEGFEKEPRLQMPPVLVVPLVDLANEPPRKRGWPLGLSRKRTPCPHSPIAHRHRANGDEMTCVGITYPDKAATKTPALALPCTHRLGQKEAP